MNKQRIIRGWSIAVVLLLSVCWIFTGLPFVCGSSADITDSYDDQHISDLPAIAEAVPDTEIMQRRIYSFDVSSEGYVLLLLEDDYLLLYRSAGGPEKCFAVDSDGSCWVYWQGNRIAILRAREHTVRTYDLNGTCCEDITPTDPVAYNRLMNELQHKTHVSVGEDVYEVEKENALYGLFCGYTYDQLSVYHANGSAEILYHTDIWKSRLGLAVLVFLLLIPAMILLALWYRKRTH